LYVRKPADSFSQTDLLISLYPPIDTKVYTDAKFSLWTILLVRKIREENQTIRGLEDMTTHFTVEYITVFAWMMRLCMPFV